MSSQPKRPSMPPSPSARPGAIPAGPTSTRPHNVRDAITEAHALGGGAVGRPSAAVAKGTGRKVIFIVHPDADLRTRLRAVLEANYDVIEAKDGMEAVEMSSSIAAPAMIVSDTAMPRVDGFTLAKILRNNPVMKKTPIMFVSAQHSPQHVTQALVIGVSQYLPKSTPVAQIAEKIRKIVL